MTETEQNKIPLPGEPEPRDPMLDFLKGDQWESADVGPYLLDFAKAYEAPRYTLSWQGVKFAPLGGIHAITGQAGNGKTMTIAQFMAAILGGEFGGLRYELSDYNPRPRVLYIDTEMEEANTIAVKNRVMTMCGRPINEPWEDFIVVMLREVPEQQVDGHVVTSAEMRWRMTLKAIYLYRPTVVFIDGLLDVVADFNDNKICQELIYKCMQTASHYGISLWCIVHQNPGGEKLVGHLGSFVERKVTDVIQTKKDKNDKSGEVTFTVSQKKARGQDMLDWKFRVEPIASWGMPVQLEAAAQPAKIEGDPIDEVERWFREAKNNVEWPATRQVVKDIIIREYGKQTNKPKQDIDLQMLINKRLLINSSVKKKGCFLLIPNEDEEQDPLPAPPTDDAPF